MAESTTSHLHITFFADAVENKAKSLVAGRPIYDDREFVRIKFAGDKHRELVAPADECEIRHPETNEPWAYKDRFPKHYEAFKAGQEFIGDGTPLAELTFLTEAKRAELRAVNVHTAEALAALDGALLQRLGMGGRALKDQATAWLEKAAGSAVETRFAAENTALREQMAALQAQLTAMAGKPGLTTASGKPTTLENMDREMGIDPAPSTKLEDASDAELKAFIKETTNEPVLGNPSRETLEKRVKAILQPEVAA